jgi:folate-binding protein YgfZ
MFRVDTTVDELTAWHESACAIPRNDVVLQVTGPGAVACLQGLFTNDIERAGPGSLAWGAVLTPKGMIITDLWLWRRESDVLAIVPEAGAPALLELFRKSFPPRLAKVTDLRHERSVWWLTSSDATLPNSIDARRPVGPAPFQQLAIAPRTDAAAEFAQAGWHLAPAAAADVFALLAGWPVLEREIDGRTLVQEVRFDELQGVRYDKGCYVGQETVSRLHFRGHPNRTLRAVVGRGVVPSDPEVTSGGDDGREMGTATTLVTWGVHWIAAVKLRREVSDGDRVLVGGHEAAVRAFPISWLDMA